MNEYSNMTVFIQDQSKDSFTKEGKIRKQIAKFSQRWKKKNMRPKNIVKF